MYPVMRMFLVICDSGAFSQRTGIQGYSRGDSDDSLGLFGMG